MGPDHMKMPIGRFHYSEEKGERGQDGQPAFCRLVAIVPPAPRHQQAIIEATSTAENSVEESKTYRSTSTYWLSGPSKQMSLEPLRPILRSPTAARSSGGPVFHSYRSGRVRRKNRLIEYHDLTEEIFDSGGPRLTILT